MSRYHRRCKDLQQITELIGVKFLHFMDAHLQNWFVMDSLPVPVCVYARASRNLRFACEFGVDNDDLYGHCASKKQDIYGMKLHLMTSTQGIPTHYVLAPAAHHDVVIAPELLESYQTNILSMGDKGYVGLQKKLQNQSDFQLIIQYTRAKSAWRLTNRVIAKITALTLGIYLNFITESPLLEVKGFIF